MTIRAKIVGVADQHPREQGFKRYSGEDRTSRARLQINIQENKDSNIARQPEHRGVADPPPTEQGFLYPHLYDGG